jgi:DNA-binding transcriptional MerR regulator
VKHRWTIGELARASAVTVRTLHYYDQIGLVRASERTPNGHRRYTRSDVGRLYRVRALHQLGCSLEEIGAALGSGEAGALRDLLTAQLADLDARAAHLDRLRSRLRALLQQVDRADAGALLTILESTVPLLDPGSFLTAAQRAALLRRGEELTPSTVDELRREWLLLVAELTRLRRDGVPPADPRVTGPARRWREIGLALRGDTIADAGIDAAATAAFREHGGRLDQRLADAVPGLAPGDLLGVVEYVGRSLATLTSDEETP